MRLFVLTILSVIGFIWPVMAVGINPVPVQSQRVELGNGTSKYNFAVYANLPINSTMGHIKNVVIIQHGLQRNGSDFFSAGLKLMAANGIAADKTLLIAPNFFTILDTASVELHGIPIWKIMGWSSGEDAINYPNRLSSFQVFDDLLTLLSNKTHFPSLSSIVIVGYSEGGAMVQRYAALNKVHTRIRSAGVDLRYVIADSPSYLYFTKERPKGRNFIPYDSTACINYNEYRYGMDKIIPYAADRTGQQVFTRYARRNVTYLLGSEDNDPNHRVLDKSCGAEAQGSNRLKRGIAYVHYERHLADGLNNLKRRAYEVDGVGHNYEALFGSKCGIAEIFNVPEDKIHTGAVCKEISY